MPALDPSYFKVDARSLSEYLVFLERYAAYIRNHNTVINDKEEVLTWQPFFASDVTVFLAKLRSLDTEAMLPFYLHTDTSDGHQQHILQKKLQAILSFVKVVNQSYWHVLELRVVAPKIFQLLKYVEHIKLNGYLGEIWHVASNMGLYIPSHAASPKDLEDIWGVSLISKAKKRAVDTERLAKAMNAFMAEALEMIHHGAGLFEESIQQVQHHNPAMALVITFLSLYQHLQEDLNGITGRHLDYFYKTLLRQCCRPSEPDYVHVYFKLSDHAKECTIAKGTLFKAGIDREGHDYLYEANDFLTVTKAKVTSLATIYLSKTKEQGAESSYQQVSGIYHSPIIHAPNGSFDFSEFRGTSVASFGEDEFRLGHQTLDVAEVGFAIASPVLLMSEGERSINIVLTYQLKSLSVLFLFLERQAKQTKSGFERVFDKVFSTVFKICLSTKEGWYAVDTYSVLPPNPGTGAITFAFTLSKGAPAIVPIGEEWHDLNEKALYNVEWPILKICIDPTRSSYCYTYLKDLRITDCTISVDVKSAKNLQVYNDLGQLDTSTPFYPFGSMPVVGSSLLVGHEELFKKNINSFSLDLHWHNLPRVSGGFKEYYKDYEESVDHDSFKVEVKALSNYEFHPQENAQHFSLFALQGAEGRVATLASKTSLQGFDVKALKINGDFAGIDLPVYDNKAKLGYIRLELIGPDMAFGHHKYPSLYAAKILKGLKSNKIEMLNAPYTPQLKSICLNYKASAKLNFEASGFSTGTKAAESAFLVQPYGIRPVYEHGVSLSRYFLPNFEHDGYLLLGLEGLSKGQDLTLYFALDPQIGNDFEVDVPKVEWFYIAGDKWVSFAQKDLIFDTTQGFTTSGIVKIAMPNTIETENRIVPKGKFWIVAALRGNVNLAARIKSLYTHALQLKWVAHRPGAVWEAPIVANSISSMVVAKPEIASIVQPLASFGGRAQELESEFYVRISERLRHRNRCVTPWDYERLVLDAFPAVSQVKCLSAIAYPEHVSKGSVIVVVVPKTGGGETLYPKFNYSVLQEIKTFLEAHAAPSVNIRVINPVYEEIKVSASILCSDENQQGIAIEQLHRDLQDLICPWYRDPAKELLLGGSLLLEDVETFIANRSYITFVTKTSLLGLHYNNGDYHLSDTVAQNLTRVVNASRPWAVLVPMKTHQLNLIAREAFVNPDRVAIENLRLGTEFVLSASQKSSLPNKAPEMDTSGAFGYISIQIDL